MDRRTLLGALGLALAAPLGSELAAEPPKYTRPGRVYNQNGAYEGRMDSSGRMYDQSGRYVGREDSSGRRYDLSLINIRRCRRTLQCRSRRSQYH